MGSTVVRALMGVVVGLFLAAMVFFPFALSRRLAEPYALKVAWLTVVVALTLASCGLAFYGSFPPRGGAGVQA